MFQSNLTLFFKRDLYQKVIFGLLLCFWGELSYAQINNLIPNPGFELNTGCPCASVYLQNTNNWHRIENHKGTPDYYYGNCDYHGIINPMAPENLPFEGSGYVGNICLLQPLKSM